jgi:hypothetical protein
VGCGRGKAQGDKGHRDSIVSNSNAGLTTAWTAGLNCAVPMPPFRLVAKLLRLTAAAATAPDARAEVGAAADPPAPSPRAESRTSPS